MDREKWLTRDDPERMLRFLLGRKGTRRMRRLFACACVRGVLVPPVDGAVLFAIATAERAADGEASSQEAVEATHGVERLLSSEWEPSPPDRDRWHVRQTALALVQPLPERGKWAQEWAVIEAVTDAVAHSPVWAAAFLEERAEICERLRLEEQSRQAQLLRCVAGDPFRPAAVRREWLTPVVVSLAQAAYDERLMPSGVLEAARLAILSDALEEAGAAGELLEHLRSAGPHARGCFVVDACLGLR